MSETVTLTINEKEITVPKGTTVIQATDMMNVEVPRFCYHPGLSVAGVCRFCMVKIEGMPKLQIGCNTVCTDGMKVTTQSDDVKEAQKWALEYHLINHPLDCPICDQAGECGLQNYYMKVGKYTSQMDEKKVLKPKALDVGKNLVLDTERCILCSRCVRFEDEITKTSSLGIFNRGDHSVIGTFSNKKIDHNYSYNLVDICPVGAFTAKDFRFKCRVWFLSETKTVCPGCSTGCNVTLYQNKKQRQYYRLKPRENKNVNGHWMCDYGRTMYEHLNAENRFSTATENGTELPWSSVAKNISEKIKNAHAAGLDKIALVLSPQYTNEEYEVIINALKKDGKFFPKVYIWRSRNEKMEDFDGLLLRGDHNSNTVGLNQVLAKHDLHSEILKGDCDPIKNHNPALTLIFGPEIESSYAYFHEDIKKFKELKNVIYFGAGKTESTRHFSMCIPTQVFSEKTGSFTNFNGIEQKLTPSIAVFPEMKGIEEIFSKPNFDV